MSEKASARMQVESGIECCTSTNSDNSSEEGDSVGSEDGACGGDIQGEVGDGFYHPKNQNTH